MYAIVDIAGQQFRLESGKEIFVHRLSGKEGDKVEFKNIILSENDGKFSFGGKGKIAATIIGHQKGDKVIAFKKKRRKGYKVKRGHRQSFTKIKIDSIV